MPFTPPFYAKFGKNYSDLWKKGFDTDHSVEYVSKTDFGVKLTSNAKIGKSDIQGKQTVEYTDKTWGKAEGQVDTATGKAWGDVTFTKLVGNTELILSGGFDPKSKDKFIAAVGGLKLQAEYKKDFVAASLKSSVGYNTNADKSVAADPSAAFQGDVAVGFDGLAVGLSVSGTSLGDDLDVTVGCEYAKPNFTATLKTEHMADVLKFSWHHKISKDMQVGAEVVSDEFGRLNADRNRTVNFATKYALNTDTSVMFRSNNWGEIAAGVEQVLRDPRMKVNAGATFSAKGTSSFTADKFGLGLTFGDF